MNDEILLRLIAIAPELEASGRELMERIATPNWKLEWGVAAWIADAFGAEADATRELVLASGALLAYARLADDLADGEAPSAATPLALAFHHLALSGFTRVVERDAAEFLAYAGGYLTQFLRGTLSAAGSVASDVATMTGEELRRRTAWRGAFVKVASAAACLAAGRGDAVVPLAGVLDEVMTGVVLLDDEFDWMEDLAAGRWNALVAFCSSLPQTPEHRDDNRRNTIAAIHLRGVAGYFALIDERLRDASSIASGVGVRGLVDFIEWYRTEVAACGDWLAGQAAAALQEASCT